MEGRERREIFIYQSQPTTSKNKHKKHKNYLLQVEALTWLAPSSMWFIWSLLSCELPHAVSPVYLPNLIPGSAPGCDITQRNVNFMGIRSSTRQMNTDSQGSQMLMIMSDAVI